MMSSSEEYVWGTSIKKGPINFTSASFEKKPIKILMKNCKIIYKPNVYQGDGSETRLNLCLAESGCEEQIKNAETQLDGNVSSCVRDDYIKCKINLKYVTIYDKDNNKINDTELDWTNLRCHALIHLKGKWESKTSTGLQLECTDLQILDKDVVVSPFA
jgi:hypothetical protein